MSLQSMRHLMKNSKGEMVDEECLHCSILLHGGSPFSSEGCTLIHNLAGPVAKDHTSSQLVWHNPVWCEVIYKSGRAVNAWPPNSAVSFNSITPDLTVT